MVSTPRADALADRVVSLATWSLLAYATSTSFLLVFVFVTSDAYLRGVLPADVAATAVYLPLLIVLVLTAVRGVRTRASWWLLAGISAVILSMIPFGGVLWLIELQLLAGLVLLIVSPRWSGPLFAVLVVTPLAVAHAEHLPQWSTYACMKTLQGGLSLAVLGWLARTIWRAQAARLELAEVAVIAERLRIDAELTRTLGVALVRIVDAGEHTADVGDPHLAAVQLQALVALSRHTLAETRRMLTRYQETSAEAELRTAKTLLSAAGVRATLELPPGGVPGVLPAGLSAELRSGISRMLADGTVRDCVISVTSAGAAAGLDLAVGPWGGAETGAA